MQDKTYICGYLLLVFPFVFGGFPNISPTEGKIWPLPQSLIASPGSLMISSHNFSFISTFYDCQLLQNAYIRYHEIMFNERSKNNRRKKSRSFNDIGSIIGFKNHFVTTLEVNVRDPCEDYPHLDMTEQYEINICSAGDMSQSMTLISQTVWGALRGLETFSQLLLETDHSFIYKMNCTKILDFPRFSHRGVLLDTSRYFLPVQKLLENMDLMAMNKFNVFHWHIVDDPSFPFESTVFPNLSAKGAYSNIHIYTPEDVETIIEYGRQRGIRVLPEFDTPGHTRSWGPGQQNLLTVCYGLDGKPDGTYGPIDPSNEDNFVFLEKLLTEVSLKFKDHYLHLGGDEVDFACWRSNPTISAFMVQKNLTSYKQLESYYITRVIDIVNKLSEKKGYMVWQEVFDNNVVLAKDTVVHVWKYSNIPFFYHEEMAMITAAGYQTLLSSCWYLNYIRYGIDWQPFYTCDPQGFYGTDDQKRLVMGGEACMWGEYVDENNLIPRLWPRASAVAERLWSNKDATTDPDVAAPRLEEHRCRLLRRGFKVQPINGPSFC